MPVYINFIKLDFIICIIIILSFWFIYGSYEKFRILIIKYYKFKILHIFITNRVIYRACFGKIVCVCYMCARVPRLRIPPSYPIPSYGAPARQRTRYPVNCYYLLYHVNVGVYMRNTNSSLSGSAIYVSRFLLAVFHNYLATKTAAYSKYFAISSFYSAHEIYSVIKTETYSSKNSSFTPIN